MPDNRQKLENAIRDLENELRSLDSLEPNTRQALQDAVRQIESVLETPLKSRQPTSLRGQLSAALVEFEASHPNLSGIVARIVDSLGQMGI